MAPEVQLQELFRWSPGPIGDPPPEVYALLHLLDRQKQIQVVGRLLEARVKMAEITGQVYKDMIGIAREAGGIR